MVSGLGASSSAEGWLISSCLVGSMLGTPGPEKDLHHLLVDSGAEIHVAPEWFASHLPLEAPATKLRLQTVSGGQIEHLGVRRVPICLRSRDGVVHRATVVFQVAPVSRPVLSAVRLAACGFGSRFEASCAYLEGPRGEIFDLARRG